MSLFATVVVLFAVVLAGYAVARYVRTVNEDLLEAQARCDRAWANVEVLLERRYDEVGVLVDLAAEHMDYERELLEELLEARERAIEAQDPSAAADASVEIKEAVSELYSLSEEYPSLRAADRFDDVRDSLREVEQRLENRREYYNDAVTTYNARIQGIPELFLAEIHGMESRSPFWASDAAREGIDVRERLHRDDGQIEPSE